MPLALLLYVHLSNLHNFSLWCYIMLEKCFYLRSI